VVGGKVVRCRPMKIKIVVTALLVLSSAACSLQIEQPSEVSDPEETSCTQVECPIGDVCKIYHGSIYLTSIRGLRNTR
jgi:hypothetical protein